MDISAYALKRLLKHKNGADVTAGYIVANVERLRRIYAPDDDGNAKLDHVREMFDDAMSRKNLPFRAVSMDSWYAAK